MMPQYGKPDNQGSVLSNAFKLIYPIGFFSLQALADISSAYIATHPRPAFVNTVFIHCKRSDARPCPIPVEHPQGVRPGQAQSTISLDDGHSRIFIRIVCTIGKTTANLVIQLIIYLIYQSIEVMHQRHQAPKTRR